jgi:hypothetical protein
MELKHDAVELSTWRTRDFDKRILTIRTNGSQLTSSLHNSGTLYSEFSARA